MSVSFLKPLEKSCSILQLWGSEDVWGQWFRETNHFAGGQLVSAGVTGAIRVELVRVQSPVTAGQDGAPTAVTWAFVLVS